MHINKLYISILYILILVACSGGKNKNDAYDSSGRALNRYSPESGSKLLVTANCFLYHRFDETKYPSTSISSSLFDAQLKYLVDHDISVITLGELFRMNPENGEASRFVILTIDDAFKSFYRYGFPILKKYGLKATLFVNTETIGSGDYLDWNELKELLDYGIEIGNHSHSHDYFLNLPEGSREDIFRDDVAKAQNLFRNRFNYNCTVFAYPFGEYDSAMKEVIRDLGFKGAAAQNSGVISPYSDPFSLPRFPMTDSYGQLSSFIEKVNMNALPVVEIFPAGTIPENNPPTLTIRLKDLEFDFNRLQCFIQGGECLLSVSRQNQVEIEIKSTVALTGRRHLYTLTIPQQRTSEWYWFSHQWIFPDRP